jgi:acyl-CoA synthetase (AMP-forming)/AMP-acid ligase II
MDASGDQFPLNQPVVWQASQEYLQRSRLKRFMEKYGLPTFEELMARSISDIAWFWEAAFEPSETLRTELEALVSRELGRRLAPKDVRFVRDITKTRNAKVMRRVIRAAYLGEPPGDPSSLLNPEAVEEIRGAV